MHILSYTVLFNADINCVDLCKCVMVLTRHFIIIHSMSIWNRKLFRLEQCSFNFISIVSLNKIYVFIFSSCKVFNLILNPSFTYIYYNRQKQQRAWTNKTKSGIRTMGSLVLSSWCKTASQRSTKTTSKPFGWSSTLFWHCCILRTLDTACTTSSETRGSVRLMVITILVVLFLLCNFIMERTGFSAKCFSGTDSRRFRKASRW